MTSWPSRSLTSEHVNLSGDIAYPNYNTVLTLCCPPTVLHCIVQHKDDIINSKLKVCHPWGSFFKDVSLSPGEKLDVVSGFLRWLGFAKSIRRILALPLLAIWLWEHYSLSLYFSSIKWNNHCKLISECQKRIK